MDVIQFFRFLLVGGCSGVIQFSTLFLALNVLSLPYQGSIIFAYVLSVMVHYGLNRLFTFKPTDKPSFRELGRYLVMIAGNALITWWVTIMSVEVLQVGVYVGTMLSIMITVGVTFMMSKYWVFQIDFTGV